MEIVNKERDCKMPIYNKLVRDNTLQVIGKTNKQFSTRILPKQEYMTEVKKNIPDWG